MSDLEDSMSEIDWSEAPCWASHWCPVCKSWLNEDEDSIDTCCIPLPAKTERDQDTSTEWVDGLPPVGDECEVNLYGYWFAATILAYGRSKFLYEILPDQIDGEGDPIGGELDGYISRAKFRPIRTEAEKQRDDLIKITKRTLREVHCYESDEDVANKIADATLSEFNVTRK